MSRHSRIVVVCLLLLAWASTAFAARIDPELKKILDGGDKSRIEIVPVLMVFPDDPVDEDLELMLEGTTPKKRRKSAIAALKRQARKAQADAWEILEDPDHPGVLDYAEMLYAANAIAFAGDREVILAVAESGDEKNGGEEPVLFYDKDYDLLENASLPGGGFKSARGDTAWNVTYLQADRVWRELGFTGKGIVIGHLDTGIDYNHPDLRRRVRVNPGEVPGNGLDDDDNGFVDDVRGWDLGDKDNDPLDDSASSSHGTHTAGSVVGDGSGGLQTGIAPGATLIPVKIFNSEGSASLSRMWAGQQYCLENGARIITMSLGIKGEIPASYRRNDRFNAAAIRAAGVIVFNSAGNYHDEYSPPFELGMTARVPAPWSTLPVPDSSTGGVITVGGTEYQSDAAFAQGSQGPAAWDQVEPWFDWPYIPGPGLIKPDVVAPAVGICSTLPGGLYSGDTWTGTSMACPQVAGVAALMLEKNPTLSPAGVDSLLELTARDLGAAGKDVVFGSGIVDAYAAVQAVPTDLMPNLAGVRYRPDPEAGGSVDPGELAPVLFDVKNVGIVAAAGVIGRLTVDSNPYVAVDHGIAHFPDIEPGGSSTNTAEPFRLAVSPIAPQGHVFHLNLTVSTAEGFERSFDLEGHVGLPEHRTHDLGRVYLTATARGSLGYLNDQQMQGRGMGLMGGPSALFLSSLWCGGSPDYICNNDLTASGADPAEWVPRIEPTGNARVLRDDIFEQSFGVAFTDDGAATPHGVEVELTTHAFADPAREDVVVLDYTIHNRGTGYYSRYYAGLFVDWDVIDSLGNVGGVDLDTRSVWVGMPDGPVFGMALLDGTPAANITVVDNIEYVYPVSHVIDAHKYQFLSGTITLPVADDPTDLSALVSAGPFELGPGEQIRVRFVMAYGEDVDDFLTNIAAVGGSSGPVTTVTPKLPETTPAMTFSLGQNLPNPFNPATVINFTLPVDGPVALSIFDLSGRLVRTLVRGQLAGGAHAVRWDGRADSGVQASSGMYFYKLEAGGEALTRKMLLIK